MPEVVVELIDAVVEQMILMVVVVVEEKQLLYKHPLQMEQEITMAVQEQQLQLQQVL